MTRYGIDKNELKAQLFRNKEISIPIEVYWWTFKEQCCQ